MATAKYTTKAEYLAAILALHQRARRSGWNLNTASRDQIASWLYVTSGTLTTLAHEHGISLDDIRTGNI